MNIKDVLRWAAILPVAAIAPTLCCILRMALVLIGDLLSGEFWLYLSHPQIIPLEHFFLSFMLFAVFGYVFVYAGASISPRYKRIVAFVLFAIVAILFGFIIIFSLLVADFADTWRMLINSIICIIAAGACSFSFEEHDDTISNIQNTPKNWNGQS